jgi:hypothetical protein
MNQNDEFDTHLPLPFTEAVQKIANAPLDDEAIERVRLAAQKIPVTAGLTGSKSLSATRPLLPQARKSRLNRLSIAMATASVIVLAALQLFGPSIFRSSLHAQVIAATKKVKTIHAISDYTQSDGTIIKGDELWFARGVGFSYKSPEVTRIDDGQHFWEHMASSKIGSRSKSQKHDAMIEQVLDAKGELERHSQRFPELDQKINNMSCHCYRFVPPTHPPGTTQSIPEMEIYVYVSEDFLVRRQETRVKKEGQWKVQLVRNWEYDVTVPEQAFRPEFGAGVEIVDADEAVQRMIDLKNAVYITERSGLIFAAHRVERFKNGGILFMTSVRGTEQTLQQFPATSRMMQPGLYFIEGPATNWSASPQGNGYLRIELATADYDGINLQWWIMIPRGQPAAAFEIEPGKAKIDFGVTPNGKYADQYKDANGVINHITWTETISIPHQDGLPTLKTLAESVYSDQALLRTLPFKHLNLGVQDINGVPTAKNGTVENTQPAVFAAAVAEHVRYWQQVEVDFQISSGGQLQMDPVTKTPGLIPGIIVDYYSIVDDETLKRFATRPNVQIVSMQGTRITSDGLKQLQNLNELNYLDLMGTAVDDAGLDHLKTIKTLRHLDVTKTKVTEAGIQRLKAAIPELKVIHEGLNSK